MSEIFTPKTFSEITAEMVAVVRGATDKLTDFNIGSVVRSILEAGAVSLDDYYREVYLGIQRAIPAAIYVGFGYTLRPAVAARGEVTITRETALVELTIPAGTILQSTLGVQYVLDTDVVFSIDETEKVATITATVVGTSGNTEPNTVGFKSSVGGGVTATNNAVIDSGVDQETEEQRAERFVQFILSLARGTVAAVKYAAGTAERYHPITGLLSERVQNVAIHEVPGYVTVWIHNGADGASAELVSEVEKLIEGYEDAEGNLISGYRAAGVEVVVGVMDEVTVNFVFELSVAVGASMATVRSAIIEHLSLWLKAFQPGNAIRPVDVVNELFLIDGVADVTLIEPINSVQVPVSHVARLGTVTWAS